MKVRILPGPPNCLLKPDKYGDSVAMRVRKTTERREQPYPPMITPLSIPEDFSPGATDRAMLIPSRRARAGAGRRAWQEAGMTRVGCRSWPWARRWRNTLPIGGAPVYSRTIQDDYEDKHFHCPWLFAGGICRRILRDRDRKSTRLNSSH